MKKKIRLSSSIVIAFLYLYWILPRGNFINLLWINENTIWPGTAGPGGYFVFGIVFFIALGIFFGFIQLWKFIEELLKKL